jgi:hypothetical protein
MPILHDLLESADSDLNSFSVTKKERKSVPPPSPSSLRHLQEALSGEQSSTTNL